MKQYTAKVATPGFPRSTVTVLANSSAEALEFLLESLPTACCISVRPA